MKYLTQVLIILLFTFIGEVLHELISWPIPAAIYGLILFLIALALKIIKLEHVKDAGHFLVGIMSVLFICPAVGLMNSWPVIKDNWLAISVIVVVSLLFTFFISGIVTKLVIRIREAKNNE
ncbi:MAG: CidA/LrgA family protein [Gammaproteobacteria bacterium]|nr:CidA/LrgA family protein [Gammaproteobacteria bacterium]